MKSFLAAVFALFPPQLLACSLDPIAITEELRTGNPTQIVSRLWDSGRCESELFRGLETGKTEWLQLARALRPHTDAWASESLQDSLGIAMQRAPSRVLRLIKDGIFDGGICVPAGLDDSPKGIRRYHHILRRAKPMFESFVGTSLEREARVCLAVLERVQAAPER